MTLLVSADAEPMVKIVMMFDRESVGRRDLISSLKKPDLGPWALVLKRGKKKSQLEEVGVERRMLALSSWYIPLRPLHPLIGHGKSVSRACSRWFRGQGDRVSISYPTAPTPSGSAADPSQFRFQDKHCLLALEQDHVMQYRDGA